MKRMGMNTTWVKGLLALCSVFYADHAMAQTDGSVELNAKILDYGSSSTKHWAVVWVTTGDNTFIKTIWRQGPSMTSTKWNDHCKTYYAARKNTVLDGYSTATAPNYSPPNSPIIEQWNCRDASGNLMPDGDYKFWVQYAEDGSSNGPYTTYGLLWTKGPGNGSTTYNYDNQGSNFSNMSVVWSPVYVPPPEGSITSANVQGNNLIIVGTGTVGAAYTVIGTTNIDETVDVWTAIGSGSVNGAGNFSNSIPIDAGWSSGYYKIRLP